MVLKTMVGTMAHTKRERTRVGTRVAQVRLKNLKKNNEISKRISVQRSKSVRKRRKRRGRDGKRRRGMVKQPKVRLSARDSTLDRYVICFPT